MNRSTLTLGSLFSGSGGFELAGILAGIQPLWNSEIEPFPIRVTTKRLPQVQHYGDVSQLSGANLPPVDVITFGSPCQDMSIAGQRAGLDGERSGLFHEAIRIIKEMREATNGAYPRYCVWENVPGAFSSNGGKDFKAVLEAVIGVKEPGAQVPAPVQNRWPYADVYLGDGWSVAYRVLNAEHWGVPQRRARIYLVGDFAGERAGDILFKSEGLSGYSAESFRAWQRAARDSEGGAGTAGVCLNDQGGGRMDVSETVTGTLRAESHGHPPLVAAGFCTEHSAQSRTIGYEEETAPTLRAGNVPAAIALEHHPVDSRIRIEESGTVQTLTNRMGTGGNNVPLIMTPDGPLAYTLKVRCGKEGGGKGALVQEEKSATLATSADQTLFQPQGFDRYNGDLTGDVAQTLNACAGTSGNNTPMVFEPKAYGNGPQGKGVGEDVSFTLNATDQQGVAAPVYSSTVGSYMTNSEEVAQTLMARDYKDPQNVTTPSYVVRRLTPTECARLQGFPDWWCRGLKTENPTEEEIAFWTEVFETHRRVVTKAKRPKTRNQIVKWLRNPHRDSAEYRMWGNAIALPCAWFVLAGIVYYEQYQNGDSGGFSPETEQK